MRRRITKQIVCLTLCVFLSACGAPQQPDDLTLFAMDTVINLSVYDDADGAAADECRTIIQSLEQALSVTDPESDVSRLNAAGSGRLSGGALALLQQTLTLSAQTGGLLDPTIYPIVKLWGFTTQQTRVPAQAEIDAALDKVGANNVRLEPDGQVTLQNGAQLDFGAVAKGYAATLCAEALARRGLCGILSLGGNVQTVGTKPDGADWRVGITDPENPDRTVAALALTGTNAVVTSGSYERYFEQDGKRYHHIMDPRTGYPAESGLCSVTVVCADGFLADGLSTALFVMGLDDAAEFWRARRDFEAVFIDDTGKIYLTEGLSGRIESSAPMEILQ